jgi:hypothetical protein
MKDQVEKFIRRADEEGQLIKDENGLIEIPNITDVRWIKRRVD